MNSVRPLLALFVSLVSLIVYVCYRACEESPTSGVGRPDRPMSESRPFDRCVVNSSPDSTSSNVRQKEAAKVEIASSAEGEQARVSPFETPLGRAFYKYSNAHGPYGPPAGAGDGRFSKYSWSALSLLVDLAKSNEALQRQLVSGLTPEGAKRLFLKEIDPNGTPDDYGAELVQRLCALVLSRLRSPAATGALLAALKDPTTGDRVRAFIPLALAFGDPWTDERKKQYDMRSDDEKRARADPGFAATTPMPRALNFLVGDLSLSVDHKEDEILVVEAIRDESVLRTLSELALNPEVSFPVRRAIVGALGPSMNENPFASDPLREALVGIRDPDPQRELELRALVYAARPRTWAEHFSENELKGQSVESLGATAKNPLVDDVHRSLAMTFIGSIGKGHPDLAESAVSQLMPVATAPSGTPLRLKAISQLIEIAEKSRHLTYLQTYVRGLGSDPDAKIRSMFVARANQVFDDPEEERQARWGIMFRDESEVVRREAIPFCKRDGPAAIPVLRQVAANDPDKTVRDRAMQVIKEIEAGDTEPPKTQWK